MRKYVALVVGTAMLGTGLYFVYFFYFVAAVVPFKLLAGAGFLAVLGGYLLWETVKEWNAPRLKP